MDKIIEWANKVDWNELFNTFLAYYHWLFYLPFPILFIGVYFLMKSFGIRYKLVNLLIATISTVICYFLYHKKQISVTEGVDFQLIGAVAIETITASSIALLAIFIFMIRGIYSMIKNRKSKPGTQTEITA